jgi:guanylate kinase
MQLFIIGRSGRGKDTLANYLATKGMKVLKSYTTREPKFEGEDSHIFISEDEVDNYPNKVASTVLNDTIYFATQEQYDDSDIYIIDPYGFDELRKKCPSDNYTLVYVEADEPVAREHALIRGDRPEVYDKRIKKEDADFTAFEKRLDNEEVTGIVIYRYKNDYNQERFYEFGDTLYNYLMTQKEQ